MNSNENNRPDRTGAEKMSGTMDKIKHALFHSWFTLKTLEDRIYHIVLDVAVFVSLISVVTGLIQRLPAVSLIMTGAVLLYLLVLQYITIRHPKYADTCRILLVLGINLILFPLHFFASGGIHGGMVLFFLTGLALSAMLVHGKGGRIVFLISLAVMVASIVVSVRYPQFVSEMTVAQHRDDVVVTLLLAGVTLYTIVVLILRAYEQERGHNQELVQKLHDLSVRDSLTGLYNRRELFHRLEAIYGDAPQGGAGKPSLAGYYIAMFDADGFKELNDSFGHSFGDEVLTSMAHVLRTMTRPENGEMTARYGGEEFVSILSAQSMEEASRRVNEIRRQIEALRWESRPSVTISVSGGLIACEDHPDLTRAMHDVDELLYMAKAAGKNRICCQKK